MAEVDLNLPTPGGDRGVWDTKLNAALTTTEVTLNDHDDRLDDVGVAIAGLEEGVGAPTDVGLASLINTDGTASQGAVIAQTLTLTERQRPVALSTAPNARREFPRLVKPLTGPIFTKAQQTASGIYWSWLLDTWAYGIATTSARRWRLYYSTDHSVGGIYYADAATPAGAWTARGMVYDDVTAGISQSETPSIIWNPDEQLLFMFYQAITGSGQQTFLATSPDGVTWTRVGSVMASPSNNPAIAHVGYFRPFRYAGGWHGYSLHGNGGYVKWFSYDGRVWTIDNRALPSGEELLSKMTGFDPDNPLRIRWSNGGVIEWNGAPWFLTTAGTYASGGSTAAAVRFVAVPLNPDLRSFLSAPIDITPPVQSWETGDVSGLGGFTPGDDGRMFTTYRANGSAGAFGLMEVA